MKNLEKHQKTSSISLVIATAALGLAACNGGGSSGAQGQPLDGNLTGKPAPTPTSTPAPTASPKPDEPSSAQIGESCQSSDPDRICLSLKYVVYKDSAGNPVVSQEETLQNLAAINQLWAQCDIAFEIGEFVPANATDYGLNFNTSTNSELTSVRRAFADSSTLLVATTGTWSGTLGAGSANAWTTMPGSSPLGVVLEEPVGTYPNIIAHELGHYLSLGHVNDASDVMNPVIYSTSTKLTTSQCNAARATATSYWSAMIR